MSNEIQDRSILPAVGTIYVICHSDYFIDFAIVKRITEKTVRFEGIDYKIISDRGNSLFRKLDMKPLPSKKTGTTYIITKSKFDKNMVVGKFTYERGNVDALARPLRNDEEFMSRWCHY
jgi:hypothetical protein